MKFAHESPPSTDSKWLNQLRARLIEAMEMETYVWTGDPPGAVQGSLAAVVHASLQRALSGLGTKPAYPRGRTAGSARAELRAHLIQAINDASLDLLKSAQETYAILSSAQVQYMINVSNDRERPQWEGFDFKDFPFIYGHAESLNAAMRLRNASPILQLSAMKFLHCKADLQSLEKSKAMAAEETPNVEWNALLKRNEAAARAEFEKSTARLSDRLKDIALEFYNFIAPGTSAPYAMPIEIGRTIKLEDLRFIGRAYRQFGYSIRVPFHLRIEGETCHKEMAQDAKVRYDEIGRAFYVLSAWVAALELIDIGSQCTICYQHASTASRCAMHATTTKETREARLGKRVNPAYLTRLKTTVRRSEVQSVLRSSLYWNDVTPTAEFGARLDAASLNKGHSVRATVLANQLRQLFPLLNESMVERFSQLFMRILLKVKEIEQVQRPVGDAQRHIRERQQEVVNELLSLKGFFRAWCGNGDYSAEVRFAMFGFDPANPVVKGAAYDSYAVRNLLISQRAWEDEMQNFLNKSMPTSDQIKSKKLGDNVKEVAANLGIAESTVYKILSRKDGRKRNHFGRC